MLCGLARSDQRQTGTLYVRGLLLDGQRKSMQPMAARLGVDHQRLQQFVTSSTWDHTPVRRNLATWADGLLAGSVFVVDDVGFPKDGSASPGVARMYCGALGKRGNCPVGVSVHLATDAASAAVDWRLFVPESWDATTISDPEAAEAVRRRRTRAKLPDTVGHRPKWQLALDMLDELTTGWGLARRPVVADAAYGEITAFRLGLEARGLAYALAVPATLSAHPAHATPIRPPYQGRGQPPKPRYPTRPASLRDLALAAEATAWTTVTWRHGTRTRPANPTAALRGRFAALRIRPASREIPRAPDRSVPERWLLVEWPPARPNPATTGCPTCPRPPPSPSWSAWPSAAGASNTTTASSNTAWGWTTTRAAASPAGTATSP